MLARRNGLPFPPCPIVHGQARLPIVQQLTKNLVGQTQAGLMPRDALRLRGAPRTCYGPLSSPQIFTRSLLESSVNSPASMASGTRVANAPRLVTQTNGASAGM
jgi:hypothetical protein